MMIVDHVTMAVSHRVVVMRMGMWLRAFPALMFMPVMFVVRVRVRMAHGFVGMFEFDRIAGRPQDRPGDGRTHHKQSEPGECRR